MSTGLRRYAEVWRLPGARTLLIGSILGRLPIGMAPLLLVLLVEGSTGSYADAGIASAAYAVANAIVGPVLGRIADRLRPAPVLLGTALAWPIAAVGVLAATAVDAPAPVLWAASALLGACLPPLTATVRSVWAELTSGPATSRLRESALALETTAFELVFVLGPMVVGALAVVTEPTVSLVVAAVLALGGTLAVASGRATRGWRPEPGRPAARGLGPAVAFGMPLLLAVSSGLAFAFGIVGVAIPAFAAERSGGDADGLAGLLLGLWGVGSVTGGLWYGTRQFRRSLPTQWAVSLGAVAAGLATLALVPSAGVMAVALLVGGLTLAPALTVENALVSRIAPAGMVNEAYTWVATVVFATSAAGAAVAGVLVEQESGVAIAFTLAALTTGAGAVAAAVPRTALRRVITRTT
ncbi:MFS transporter [Cryptosporangium aurantiacum]|uniref:Predicted arabinose efflux permease, MFS family n=1 Tax=Cryptosporangium aurantiacum TaxID=134849 RepID=A0A1M7RMC3_9ACTN|nr:MFS transporter [Cryptosporangium aurantiacum]SHN47404.1 Predicted arabinose efflux permease, MFS family [Cryptosporangium aurantiacum]